MPPKPEISRFSSGGRIKFSLISRLSANDSAGKFCWSHLSVKTSVATEINAQLWSPSTPWLATSKVHHFEFNDTKALFNNKPLTTGKRRRKVKEGLTLYSLLSTLYSLLSTLYSLLSTLYSLLSTLYSLQSTLALLSTPYSLLSTLYSLFSTLYSLAYIFPFVVFYYIYGGIWEMCL